MYLPEQIDHVAGTRKAPAHVRAQWLHDPSTGQRLVPQRESDPHAIEQAIATADAIHRSGSWSRLTPQERAAYLENVANALDRTDGGLAGAESLGSGVVISVTRLFAGSLAGSFRGAIDQLLSGWTNTELAGPVGPVRLRRRPWGPAVVLVPWNAPTAIAAGKIANALAAGCPVILKPPEWAPLSCNVLADAIDSAGLPTGLFQMLHGGPSVGAALVNDRRIRVVSFTGGLATGRAIAQAAADDFKAVQLELGGNNPAIVLADSDIDATADALATGMTKLNGQWCEAPGKVLVALSRYDDLVDALSARLAKIRTGAALDESAEMGPLSHETHRNQLDNKVAGLTHDCGETRIIGDAPDLGGWFWMPRLVLGVAPTRCVDELFGPVMTIHPVKDAVEAVNLANDTPYGLAGYVFGADLDTAMAVGCDMNFGEVKINGTSVLDLAPQSTQSFWGLSGIGSHGAKEVFRFFCGSQIVGADHLLPPL